MIILRLFIGIFKGVIVGGLLGGGLWYLETGGNLQASGAPLSFLRWPLYGLVGLVAGLVSGRPPWSKGSAWISSILKGLFGFGVCVGLYFLLDYLVGNLAFMGRPATAWYFAVGAALGAIYAAFIEVDDSIGKKDDEPKKGAAKKPAKPAACEEPAEPEAPEQTE
jgi:hypothetical protein